MQSGPPSPEDAVTSLVSHVTETEPRRRRERVRDDTAGDSQVDAQPLISRRSSRDVMERRREPADEPRVEVSETRRLERDDIPRQRIRTRESRDLDASEPQRPLRSERDRSDLSTPADQPSVPGIPPRGEERRRYSRGEGLSSVVAERTEKDRPDRPESRSGRDRDTLIPEQKHEPDVRQQRRDRSADTGRGRPMSMSVPLSAPQQSSKTELPVIKARDAEVHMFV